jgi:hypothetical protein
MVKYNKLGMFQQGCNLVFNHGMEKRMEENGLGHVFALGNKQKDH